MAAGERNDVGSAAVTIRARLSLSLAFAALIAPACGGEDGGGGGGGGGPMVEPIQIRTSALPDVALGAPYDEKLEVVGGTPPYAFALAEGALPDGLVLTPDVGRITGTADAPGPFPFTVRVSDPGGRSATQALRLYVTPEPLDIATSSVPEGQEQIAYRFELRARGGVPPFVWTQTGGTLPTGITLDADGVLSGTAVDYGPHRLSVELADAEGRTVGGDFDLLWRSLEPMIRTRSLARARAGRPYEVELVAEGGLPPYTWAITDGMLPAGLSLSPNGGIDGTPSEAGSFAFRVGVTDRGGRSDAAGILLVVIEPLRITTAALPSFVRGRAGSAVLEAEGGVPPYTWSTDTILPTGLQLFPNGTFGGTPDAAFDDDVVVQVADSEGVTARGLFRLVVAERAIFRVDPMISSPQTCTSTNVVFARALFDVPDSMQIASLEVLVDVSFRDAADNDDNDRLKLTLFAPDGSQTPLCGNGAGVRGWRGCDGRAGVSETWGPANPAKRPLEVHTGSNPVGTWRLWAGITKPTSTMSGDCAQRATIRSFALLMETDRSTEPYVRVRGFAKNNLAIEPWARIGAVDRELFLVATIYDVGPNGRREGGAGDDVPRPDDLTWTFGGMPEVATVSPDGHVTAGRRTGSGPLTATGGGLSWQSTLRIFPPDWDPRTRQF